MTQFTPYHPQQIEADVQAYWQTTQAFKATEDPEREKFYCLSMFPYPSGKLHMGHVRNYTIGDVIARYQRMLGKNVLQPMGWDAFGLPAENAALKQGQAPADWTRSNIAMMRQQLNRLGFAYDWDREITTCDADYYRWEQWLFTRLVEKGLAYRKQATVNWDPVDQTVLANEQVIEGRGWRSGAIVEKRDITQWFLKITDYAEELLQGIDQLTAWPEQVRTMQRHWIGRSHGVRMRFGVSGQADEIEIYTTRPDTVMGVTYLAVAAEHPLVTQRVQQDAALANFVQSCQQGGVAEAELERIEKRGYPLNLQAIHPISGDQVPIYVANFVLMSYGTGAVMAVPAHDQRDWEFACQYNIPVRQVIVPAGEATADISQRAFTEPGVLINSGPFDGLTSSEASDAIADWLIQHDKGDKQTQYRLRDWGVSRQRYWGCPIPVVRQADGGVQTADELPVVLPEDLVPDGTGSPLKKSAAFYDLGDGQQRETDTLDTFFESSWYYARYCCPDADQAMLDERARYWLPVDQYVGGIEHAILHLLYARFFNKLLRDEHLVTCDEPFTRLLTQGMVVAETYYRVNSKGGKDWYNPAEVEVEKDEKGQIQRAWRRADGQPVISGGVEKMSKSKNNGIDPQRLIDQYGADTVRLYVMFTAPPQQSLTWSDDGVEGAHRFLNRLWALTYQVGPVSDVTETLTHTTTAQVRYALHSQLQKALSDYDRQHYNTVVSACMSMLNLLQPLGSDTAARTVVQEGLSLILRLLAPITPHITHHLWRQLGYGSDILLAGWPQVDQAALQRAQIQMALQVNGKVRAQLTVAADADEPALRQAAQEHVNVQRFIRNKAIRKIIVVPGRLVNIVVA